MGKRLPKIRKRKSGGYETQITVVNPDGKRGRKSLYASTYREVEEKLIAELKAIQDGLPVKTSERGTVRELLSDYYHAHAPTKRVNTQRWWRVALHEVNAHLGDRQWRKIRPADVRYLQSELLKSLSPQSANLYVLFLRQAYRQAYLDGEIAKNPCESVRTLKESVQRYEVLTPEEVKRLCEVEGQKGDLWFLLATTGMRIGEALGLTRRDIDLDAGTIKIERTRLTVEGKTYTNPPKSRRGNRTITLDAAQLERIRGLMSRSPDVALFRSSHSTVLGWWKAVRRQIGLPPQCRMHDLRHTAATLMLQRGVPIPTVARVLGDKETTILNTYAHCLPSNEAEAISALVKTILEA